MSNIDQTAILSCAHTRVVMERLRTLYREYEENTNFLSNPLDLADLQRLKERRQAILREAQALAQVLNISEPQWFSLVV